MSVTIFHNPRCSKSRSTLQLLIDRGVDTTVVEYLKNVPTAEELEQILTLLRMEPRELMRKGEAIYKEAGLDSLKSPMVRGIMSAFIGLRLYPA